MSVLQEIDRPRDIKSLTPAQLAALAQEIREEILRTISTLGGHLASSLGAVELCLALHYVFDAPDDQLVWDMGYQAFAHKLITGRRERFHTLKQFKGLSGFSHKDESPYDPFSSGHGGTVLSTALGLAMARDQVQGAHDVVAIIGDASLGEGMALEALNHIGHLKPNLLVILNDNRMSIAQPVGGLSRYLNRIITNPIYNRIRGEIEQLMERLPHGSRLIRLGKKVEESLKGLLVPGLVFEELGFRYVGPINGHSLPELIATLKNLRRLKGPILLHISTLKGKGYRFAEDDPERFHKTEPFDLKTGQPKSAPSLPVRLFGKPAAAPAETFTDAFSDELIRLGQTNSRLVAITAAMPEGTGVSEFAKHFPERCIDVGMAEQHALGLAAGLARGGARPIVAIYSTFLQRAYDQIMHELCLQELPVILAIDRASLVGEDGPTHHGVFDVAYLRVLPNLRVLSPKDPAELRLMLQWALQQDRPVALRYARGGIICGTPRPPVPIALGKAELLRDGKDLALVALGSLVYPALAVAEALGRSGVEAMVINARFVKPLDEEILKQAAATGAIVTLEEAQIAGGFGSAVSEALGALGVSALPHLRIGLPDAFVEHGKRSELLQLTHLDPQQLIQRVHQWYASVRPSASESLRVLTHPS
ncbi:MAG: 1-deoxy-D-xylulose-5-phosphate synthase [Candidatus Omnitrophica bacterium CG11_big_fil_rev_8_21_14_0_20_63_9]|nr:MAG: 1-deoxy-D-xylulose-5-phosphate synthase [Candidatus Omnitrophica bacterium CG11_big_fil_rev_8_21_14_0_20_63_9]